MSLFNIVVPMHVLSSDLLYAIRWALPIDKESKYPLLGRLRYVWLDENLNVCLLLKDGPTAWTEEENKASILNQITNHESYVSHEVYSEDKVYLIAKFKPITWSIKHEDKNYTIPGDTLINSVIEKDKNIQSAILDEPSIAVRYHNIYENPFAIFKTELEHISTNNEAMEFGKKLEKIIK